MDLRQLLVTTGIPVSACGPVVLVAGGRALLVDQTGLVEAWGRQVPFPEDTPGLVPLVGEVPGNPGDIVTVTGVWTGTALSVASVHPEPNVSMPSPPALYDPSDGASPDLWDRGLVAAAERPLWDAGALVGRVVVRTGGSIVVRVSTHDPVMTARALLPVFGEALEVVQSPFSADDYARVDALIEVAERAGVLVATSQETDSQAVVRRSVEVTHVVPAMVAAAAPIPDGLVTVGALVYPVPSE